MKWQPVLVIIALLAAFCTAGCTDGEPAPVAETKSPALPGQQLVSVGAVTGNGTRGGTIDIVSFRIALAPGVTSADIESLSIIYADAVRTERLVPVAGFHGTPPQGSWAVLGVIGEEGIANNRIELDEQFVIAVNPRAPVVPRQFITIIVQTPSGPPLTLRRVAPASIVEENTFVLP